MSVIRLKSMSRPAHSLIRPLLPKSRLPGNRTDSPKWISGGTKIGSQSSIRFILTKERGIFLLTSAAVFKLKVRHDL